jgi:mannose-1-phosphate guanylyltransferase/mannose-6-phosphate isomerase
MKIVVTILSGGAGSRLWPVSRENYPKPFIKLQDQQSLLQKAFIRGTNLPDVIEVLTVTNRELLFLTLDDYASFDKKDIRNEFILEPFGRNTAPAIIAAALEVEARHGKDTLMLVLPADHIVLDNKAFKEAVKEAVDLALNQKLVTFGIKPSRPDTSYGYIERKGSVVKRFIEKPNLQKAQEFFNAGDFFWNAGMFCFSVNTFLDEMVIYASDILTQLKLTIKNSRREIADQGGRLFLDSTLFDHVTNESIDYALFEKSTNVAVVPCDIGWSDVGSWKALTDLMDGDENGNRIQGEALLYDTKNSSVYGQDRMISLLGVENLIVVETVDALLVMNKDRSQDVKQIYAKLKEKKTDLYRWHKEVHRPWGSYRVLCESERFKVKRIYVKPLQELSLQKHQHRAEHWIVVRGRATIINNEETVILNENESTYISKGHVHKLMNRESGVLEIIEVQSGDYVDEDDIERISDKYLRQ